MGGSGGGGGSAGEVSWPAYVSEKYTGLLGAFTGGGFDTCETALGNAQDISWLRPAYDSTNQQTQIVNAYTEYGQAVLDINPFSDWPGSFGPASNRYAEIIGNEPLFKAPTPVAVDEILGMWVTIGEILDAPEIIDSLWVTPEPSATTDIASAWTDPTLDADDDIKADMAAAAQISAATTAYGNRLDDRITSEVLPRFQAGMRDINAVQSSAFVIGRAIIEGMADRDVANFDADLTYKAFLQRDNLLGQAHMQIDKLNAMNTDSENKSLTQAYLDQDKILAGSIESKNKVLSQANMDKDKLQAESLGDGNKLRSQALIQADKIMADSDKAESLINAEMARHKTTIIYQEVDSHWKHIETSLDLYKSWAAFVIDANRITYVMSKEQTDKNNELDMTEAKWDLDMVQIAGNLVASISGGTSYTPGPTPAQNALGGAFAGAGVGARASGGSLGGTAAGAILGGIGAYLMG